MNKDIFYIGIFIVQMLHNKIVNEERKIKKKNPFCLNVRLLSFQYWALGTYSILHSAELLL